MENSYRRHDMSDAMWEMLKPYTIGNKGTLCFLSILICSNTQEYMDVQEDRP